MKKEKRYEDSHMKMPSNTPHMGTTKKGGPEYKSNMMSKKMGMMGHTQGDMSPMVENYQKPTSDYSQEGFSKTLEYVERQNAFQMREANTVEKQAYKGRYS